MNNTQSWITIMVTSYIMHTHFWEDVDLPEAVIEVGQEGGSKVLCHLSKSIAGVLFLL